MALGSNSANSGSGKKAAAHSHSNSIMAQLPGDGF
jgi:hypothetical protein